jgi:hypothetical protein
MKVKTLAQMNAERAAKRTQLDLLDGESYQIRKIKKAASHKLQASSATKKTQLNNRVKK